MRSEFEAQLRGKRLTTAEVLYYLPDHPSLLQRFMWQTLDVAPEYPRVHQFLEFWRREIDAVIHSVKVSAMGEVRPARVRIAGIVSQLH
jgi:uncharacterized protein Usg